LVVNYELLKLIEADESHRKFSYQVKKEAEGEYITELFGWDEDFQREFFAKDWNTHKIQIITYDGKSIGTISITKNEDHIELGLFFILPAYQNKGIGTYLMKPVLDEADRLNQVVKVAYLVNNPVESLYIRHGFQVTGYTDTHKHMERKPCKK